MRIQFIILALELLWNYCDESVKEGIWQSWKAEELSQNGGLFIHFKAPQGLFNSLTHPHTHTQTHAHTHTHTQREREREKCALKPALRILQDSARCNPKLYISIRVTSFLRSFLLFNNRTSAHNFRREFTPPPSPPQSTWNHNGDE